VDLIAKFSAGCDERETNLARELIAACLAADLGLPVPEPLLVEIDDEWIGTISDAIIRARVAGSCRVAFGSTLMTGQYSVWNSGTPIPDTLRPTAAAIFVFDAIIQNADRREENPNCLVNGESVRIFDHELAFMHRMILGWRPPWAIGSLQVLEAPGKHIFRANLVGCAIDYAPIKAAWTGITDQRLAGYRQALPPEWMGSAASIDSAISLIRDARDNIDGCLVEVNRVLT
jgi:hypothetical protein